MAVYGETYAVRGHYCLYLGSGVIYKCQKCGAVLDVFNGFKTIKSCRDGKKSRPLPRAGRRGNQTAVRGSK